MSTGLFLDEQRQLRDAASRAFDPWAWRWRDGERAPGAASAVTPVEALRHLAWEAAARRLPIGVIGPREATAEQAAVAEAVGADLAAHGLTLVCGGRQGVMAAAARGARRAGGLTVGLLPGSDWREANDDIVLPIATGFGEGRNMIIAKACLVLVAVGASYGTLSEVAYGLHFDKPVLGLAGAAAVPGLVALDEPAAVVPWIAAYLLLGKAASAAMAEEVRR